MITFFKEKLISLSRSRKTLLILAYSYAFILASLFVFDGIKSILLIGEFIGLCLWFFIFAILIPLNMYYPETIRNKPLIYLLLSNKTCIGNCIEASILIVFFILLSLKFIQLNFITFFILLIVMIVCENILVKPINKYFEKKLSID